MADVFLSYAREDLPFVRELTAALQARNRQVWIDLEDIIPSARWLEEIRTGITGSDAVVFVITPDSVASEVCRTELDYAIESSKRLIPVLAREIPRDSVPPALAELNWLPFLDGTDFEAEVDRLIEVLNTDIDRVHLHTRLLTRAREWASRDRDRSLLLRGHELKRAETWLADQTGRKPAATPAQVQLILASRRGATRRQRSLGIAGGAVAVVMALLATIALVQRGRADREAEAARRNEAIAYDRLANLLASESNTSTVSRHDPQRALLLALTAADMRTTEVTRTALYEALESQPHLMRILTGHMADKFFSSSPSSSSGISDLLYHPRTGELISSGEDGKIIRWDPATGRRRVLGTPHYLYRGGIGDIAISPDGARLASAGVGNTAVWDTTTARPSLGPNQRLGGRLVVFDPDGRLQVMGCLTSLCASTGVEFRVWDPVSWQQVSSFRYSQYIMAVAINRTSMAGSGCLQSNAIETDTCAHGFIQLWDTATGQARGEPLVAPGKEIISVDFSPDGTRIIAGTRDGRIQLWDVAGRRMVESWQGHTGIVRAVRFSPDGQHIATAGQDGRTILWSAANVHAKLQTFSAYNSPVTALAFSPDGRQLATGNELNIILLWSLEGTPHTSSSFRNADTDPRSVAVSPDGKTIVLGGADGIITVYDKETRRAITRFPVASVCPHKLEDFKRPYHPCYINVLRFSPDGGVLLAASSSGNIGRWDTRTWTSLGDPLDADVPCRSLVCDRRTLTATGLAVSPDLRMVAVGGKRRIWVWNLTNRKLTYTFTANDDDVTSLAFNSDGRLLASGSKDKTILLWDLRDGHRTGKPMRHEDKVTAVAFQPRQNRLASNGADNTVRIWDTDTQEQVSSFRNDSTNYQPELTFSKDGTYLATTATNYYIALWDTATQTLFPRFQEPTSVMAVTFNPVRPELVSIAKGSGPNAPMHVTTRGYDLAEWKQRACRVMSRNLDFQLIETYTLGKTQVCPDLPVDGSVVRHSLEIAQSRLNQQDSAGTSAAYREATRLAMVNHNDDAELANLVCLHGTVSRYVPEVLPACDHAVALSPDSGPFRSSRAVTRALAGDRTGAIEDLQFFVDWANSSGLFQPNAIRLDVGVLDSRTVAQRQTWIADLKNNGNPFTAQTVNSVWTEYLQDQGGNTYQTCPVNVGARIEWVQRSTGC